MFQQVASADTEDGGITKFVSSMETGSVKFISTPNFIEPASILAMNLVMSRSSVLAEATSCSVELGLLSAPCKKVRQNSQLDKRCLLFAEDTADPADHFV